MWKNLKMLQPIRYIRLWKGKESGKQRRCRLRGAVLRTVRIEQFPCAFASSPYSSAPVSPNFFELCLLLVLAPCRCSVRVFQSVSLAFVMLLLFASGSLAD